jgi:hypothetical protein
MESLGNQKCNNDKLSPAIDLNRRAITYSMDALIPGLYLWIGSWSLRIGGSVSEDSYNGVLHSAMGIAIVLPGYRIYTTYKDRYDP